MSDETQRQAFLALPRRLYPHPVTSRATEEAILRGTHPICRWVDVHPFVVRRGGQVLGRCAVGFPQNSALSSPVGDQSTAMLGFFECVDDQAVADELFDWARAISRDRHYSQLVGPVDASFWIRYRMKIDQFSDPYTGEPCNLSSYPRLWERAGWEVWERYTSNVYGPWPKGTRFTSFEDRHRTAADLGYRFQSVDIDQWDETLSQVHQLIMRLYSGMPLFHPLPLADFASIFAPLRHLVDPELIRLAYRENQLEGFSITIPDYGDLTNRSLSAWTLARIAWRKNHYQRIVALYIGSTTKGLASAMAGQLIQPIGDRHLTGIGALIRQGHASPVEKYGAERIVSRRHYALWKTSL